MPNSKHKKLEHSPKQRLVGLVSPYMSSSEDEDDVPGMLRTKQVKKDAEGACSKEEAKNFKKAMKESHIHYKNIRLDENMKKFVEDKQRKEKMLIDSEIYFRNASQKAQTSKINDPSQELLKEFNRVVLQSDEDLIQGRIRNLLKGTELEDIAGDAQIVITVQADA